MDIIAIHIIFDIASGIFMGDRIILQSLLLLNNAYIGDGHLRAQADL